MSGRHRWTALGLVALVGCTGPAAERKATPVVANGPVAVPEASPAGAGRGARARGERRGGRRGGILYECNQPKVKLTEERGCVRSLVDLYQLKFADPVKITFEVKGDPKDVLIVPNLFTPLIENAFKHGDLGSNKKGFIEIICNIRIGYIYFSVKNSKSVIAEQNNQPGGIGIKNLVRRFEINYSPRAMLKLKDSKDYFQGAMKIPR